MQRLASQDINWWTGLLWFFQLFGLSFWRHPFTAEHPLMSKWCNATFVQIWWRNKVIYIHISTLRLYLFLLLLGCFDDTRVGLPGLAKVVEESQTVEQEGQVDGDEREMCGELRKLCLIWKWSDMWPSMVTHTRNSCSAFTRPSAHTQQWTHTHTHREHTPGAVGSHICCGTRGAVGGSVSCSRAPRRAIWRLRERCTLTSPTNNPCRTETRTHNL